MEFPYRSAVPGVLGLTPYQPGKSIEELERGLGIPNAIKLASNENPLGPSPLALAAMHESGEGVERYPDANGDALKHALASRLDVSADRITLGNGSNDVLDLVARSFAAPGDEVVFSQYAFLVYTLVTRAVGAEAIVVPAQDWGHDPDAMASVVGERTKLVFIANPNNPTGTYLSIGSVQEFLRRVPEHVVVVIDEAYYEYVDAPGHATALDLIDNHSNLVITRTFSKVFGLAGLRIGYGVASPEITDLLNRVRQPFNTSNVAQSVALAALDDEAHLRRSHESNREQLDRLKQVCTELGLNFIPSVANFLSVEFGEQAQTVYESLLQKGVIVRPLANYDMPHHLRITIGRAQEMDQLFAALKTVLA